MYTAVANLIKSGMYRTNLGRIIAHRYTYCFVPEQLCFLSQCVTRTAGLPGPILEVGCFAGNTTVWLNTHMNARGIEKPYIAIDTFNGFTDKDMEFEKKSRGRQIPSHDFKANSKRWFDRTMHFNGIRRVQSIQADASAFDYSQYRDISFVLIDVDLYLPVMKALEKIYPLMAKGGIIVVDDCVTGQCYDGALQAYTEFVSGKGLPSNIVHTKLGVIEIPA